VWDVRGDEDARAGASLEGLLAGTELEFAVEHVPRLLKALVDVEAGGSVLDSSWRNVVVRLSASRTGPDAPATRKSA